MATGDNGWILNNLNDIIKYWNNTLQEITVLLTTSPKDFRGGGIWDVISNIHGTMQAIGYALLVLFFCFGVFKSAANVVELKRPEVAFKMFVRFALAKAAISHGMELLLTLFGLCQNILGSVAKSMEDLGQFTATLPTDIAGKVQDVPFFSSIPLWLLSFIGYGVVIFLCFSILITVYGRFFRLYIYTAIAPIPMSSFAGEATSSMGKSFLKAYVGVSVEGITMMVACVIFSIFASTPSVPADATGDAFSIVSSYLLDMIFNLLILTGTMKMSERLSKEFLGL